MNLVVGLGNPGEKYENTRHNVGFLVLDEIKSQISNFQFPISKETTNFQFSKKFNAGILTLGDVILAKPNTFMNDSGITASKIASFYKISPNHIYIVHDDLDIKLGEYKIQKGVGPKVHNGVNSIEEKLGTEDFWRVRVGVDNRTPENRIPGGEYVLQDFNGEEMDILTKLIPDIVSELTRNL